MALISLTVFQILEEKFAREKRDQQLFYARNQHLEEPLLLQHKSEPNGPDVHQRTPPSHDNSLTD
jgi:hypothetical protein